MARDRVIQDSEDEDDPLCVPTSMGPPPKKAPSGQDASTRSQGDINHDNASIRSTVTVAYEDNAEDVADGTRRRVRDGFDGKDRPMHDINGYISGLPTGLYFNDSIQSRDEAHAYLSSFEQRREEKWPSSNGIGRTESIGE